MSFIDPQLQSEDSRPPPYSRPSDQERTPVSAPYYPNPSSGYSATPPAYHQSAPPPAAAEQDEQDQQSPGNNDESKRPRACESCRGLKVRCDQDPNNPDAQCKRCAKANRQCIYTQPSRKRQKKADGRVADLERKLDALTAALHAQQYAGATGMYPPAPQESASPSARMQAPHQQRYPEPPSGFPQAPMPPTAGPPVPNMQNFQDQDQQYLSNKRRRIEGSTDSSDMARLVKEYNKDPWDLLEKEQSDRLARNGIRRELYPVAPEIIIKLICDVLDAPTRTRIFERFVNDCLPTLPALAFPADTKAQDVLESKPILFLVIMAAAGWGHLPQDAQSRLAREIMDIFADCVLRHAIKSLELVQAMLVAVMWYRPPERPEQVNFYMIVHMAACMALDIGLGKRFSQAKARRGFGGPACDLPPGRLTAMVDSDSIEARRTWLACYYLCAAVAMSLRRPNLLRWSNYMQECTEFLETSPDALPTDRNFIEYVRLQKICEDISNSFQMDDPSATAISISDPKVSYTLDVFEQKLQEWHQKLPEESKQKSHLMFLHEVAVLYLHEIAMHVNHNVDDFKLPFTEESLRSGAQHSEVLTQRQMASLEKCLKSAQKIISTYASFGFEAAGNMPTLLFFIRCAYALVVLIKMHMAVVTPGSEVAKIIKPEDVRVEEHMDLLWSLFQRMARFDGNRPHGKAFKILSVLRDWFLKHQEVDKDGVPKAAATTGPSAAKPAPFGRNPHGVVGAASGNSKLQVLSEAATAGQQGGHTSPSQGRDLSNAANPANQTWTVDSPTIFNVRQGESARHDSQSTASGPTAETTPSNTATTPRQANVGYAEVVNVNGSMMPKGGSAHGTFGQGFNNFFSPTGTENLDWTAGMDLDQVLEGAFRDIDASGDLGGWFFGDGVGAYQIPGDGGVSGGQQQSGMGGVDKGW
ncbi:Fungal Zn(2)-Cys(6) binuclear cluster domain-containing protein 8 [Elsinoe fawcettii]|nr:Fungal Zn(2)-Cys(6) binuclear cluster domain-containing protein 8 [Elsinoe fawcettii]